MTAFRVCRWRAGAEEDSAWDILISSIALDLCSDAVVLRFFILLDAKIPRLDALQEISA